MVINLLFLENILNLLAPNESYTQISKTFILWTMPASLLELHFEVSAKFNESQLIYKPVLLGLCSALVLNPVLCYITLSIYKLGVWGCIITTNSTAFIKLLVITITSACIKKTPEQLESAGMFDFQDFFQGFKKLVIMVMTCTWSTFMQGGGVVVTGFLAVRLGEQNYAKYIILMNISNIFQIISYSLYNTCCILVGNIVGVNKPDEIRTIMKNFYLIFAIVSVIIVTLIVVFHNPITFFFTEIDTIRGTDIFWEITLIAFGEMLACLTSLNNGLIIGLEKIKRASIVSFFSFFIILPVCSYIIGIYFEFGLIGIVLSYVLCHTFGSVSTSIMICFLNYEKICNDYNTICEVKPELESGVEEVEYEPEEIDEDEEGGNYVIVPIESKVYVKRKSRNFSEDLTHDNDRQQKLI